MGFAAPLARRVDGTAAGIARSIMIVLIRLFSLLLHWLRGVRGARAALILITSTGIIAGLGSTVLIATVNEVLTAGSSSRKALILRFICVCLIIPAAGFASHWMVIRLSAKSA